MDNSERNNKIEDICQKYSISGYDINDDGTIDAYDGVDLCGQNLTELPLRFNKVIGDFICVQNKLSTLYGCPIEVTGDFLCCENELTSLEFGPSIIGECFYCCENKLTSLEFGPSKVGGNYFCDIDFHIHSFI